MAAAAAPAPGPQRFSSSLPSPPFPQRPQVSSTGRVESSLLLPAAGTLGGGGFGSSSRPAGLGDGEAGAPAGRPGRRRPGGECRPRASGIYLSSGIRRAPGWAERRLVGDRPRPGEEPKLARRRKQYNYRPMCPDRPHIYNFPGPGVGNVPVKQTTPLLPPVTPWREEVVSVSETNVNTQTRLRWECSAKLVWRLES